MRAIIIATYFVVLAALSAQAQAATFKQAKKHILKDQVTALDAALANTPALVEETDSKGGTLLHWAAGAENVQAVSRLLMAGADPLARTKRGRTPLEAQPPRWSLENDRIADLLRSAEEKITDFRLRGLSDARLLFSGTRWMREWSGLRVLRHGHSLKHGVPYPLGEGIPVPNLLTYYVEGDTHRVSELRLVLTVNQPADPMEAILQLDQAALVMAREATGQGLPQNVNKALLLGQSAEEKLGEFNYAVTRADWPSGKGYELAVTIE